MAARAFHQNARLEWNVAARPQIDEVFSALGYTITASHEGADNLIANRAAVRADGGRSGHTSRIITD
jgi:hypothetical protein